MTLTIARSDATFGIRSHCRRVYMQLSFFVALFRHEEWAKIRLLGAINQNNILDDLTGCRTGNGGKLRCSQAEPGQDIKSAVV